MPPGKRAASLPSQERVVIQRSGNACAYPDCGIDLVVDSRHPLDTPKSTGKVAHICAASPGGPRYDPEMTDEQRGSADNLMFLCEHHHSAIDHQLHFHTVEFLRTAKRTHENRCHRAVQHAMGQLGYPELELVCKVLETIDDLTGPISVPLDVQEKIELNKLGDTTSTAIQDGLAQAGHIGEFVQWQSSISAGFGTKLAARFKSLYFGALAQGLKPDQVFDDIVARATDNAGPGDSAVLRAASIAVTAFMFERCEIFEHVAAAS